MEQQQLPHPGGPARRQTPQICALCGHAGRGEAAWLHLTHGVAVWLCAAHRNPAFLRRRRGRVFAERLEAVWRATGSATRRRLDALQAHRNRMSRPAFTRARPGSYAWPGLRREAERRFAAGEAPAAVIDELRSRHGHAVPGVPSIRTMRRWFAQARWLTPPRLHRPLRSSLPELPYGMVQDPLWPLSEWWIDDRPAHRRRGP